MKSGNHGSIYLVRTGRSVQLNMTLEVDGLVQGILEIDPRPYDVSRTELAYIALDLVGLQRTSADIVALIDQENVEEYCFDNLGSGCRFWK